MKLFTVAYYVYMVIFLLGLPANLLALYAFSRKIHTKASPTDILLLNLTISDLLFLLCLPLKMHEAAHGMLWLLPEALCLISTYVYYSTLYTSATLLTATSMDRYMCVGYAVWYRQHVRPLHGLVASVLAWILSLSHFSYLYVIELVPKNFSTSSPVCYDNFTEAQMILVRSVRLELCVVFFALPLLISSFCYVRFILILSRTERLQPGKRRKAVGMAAGTLLVFVVCFLPYNLTHVLGYATQAPVEWRAEALLLTATNAISDPIIFYFSSSAFQGNLWGVVWVVWRRICCKTNGANPAVEPSSGPTP
ncbi:hypothetical protein ACEWY4_019591 [Coilia grayii]|uniref:G-protein coupled receptors family 1 profile domain-containing protein n=1 Tax=Coilia grayii TaxID=363190 RepID=A0ABD1JA55_9TELE